jgi:SPP1 family predicted phage head-tail adaptor
MADFSANAGDLQTRITFQAPTINKDDGGAQVPSYENVASHPTVWSAWVYDHGQESVQGNAVQSVQRATVTIRYRSDVTGAWQVVKDDGSKWALISEPENVQDRNRWSVFRVERVKGTI